MNVPEKPQILIAIRPPLYDMLFGDEQKRRLADLGDLTMQAEASNLTQAQLANRIGGQDIVIASWGTPTFSDAVLASADRLKLVAYAAGSIKLLTPPPFFAAGRRLTHAAPAMARSVAESTLLYILLSLRQTHKIDRAFREHSWAAAKAYSPGEELTGKRIGIVGAGHTGKATIRVLKALDTELWLYDPYVSEAAADKLGVKKVSLERLMRGCPIVTMQAPATAETYRMIGAEQFAWLRDGAIFINTARAHLIDEAALLAELQSGRISAALDVFDQEPLPADSPLRALDNVILSPHSANETRQTYARQGQFTVDEVERYLRAGELRYEVTRDMLDTMA